MKCKKCTKEIDEQFAFCPFCGTKNENKLRPFFNNAEFLSICNEKQLERELEILQNMTSTRAFGWLREMHEGILVYGIHAKYEVQYIYSNNNETSSSEGFVTENEAIEIASGKIRNYFVRGQHRIVDVVGYSFRIEERNLTKTMAKSLGELWFYDREDAEQIVAKVSEEKKRYLEKLKSRHAAT